MGEQLRLFRLPHAVLRGLCLDLISFYPVLSSDFRKVISRSAHEGDSFVLAVLPSIGRYLDAGLATGILGEPPAGCLGKVRAKARACSVLPTFFSQLFPNGKLCLDKVDTECIRRVRALLLFSKKIECERDDAAAIEGWATRVSAYTHLPDNPTLETARTLVTDLFRDIDTDSIPALCRNGPGAVADKIRPHQRWELNPPKTVTSEILLEALRLNARHLDVCPLVPCGSHGITRVIAVPKDYRGARIISCEPASLQFLQQGIARLIMSHIDARPLGAHRFDRIRFEDQFANRELALRASEETQHDLGHLRMATIDMKDASDRVSLHLVCELFRDTSLLPLMLETRSQEGLLPSGRLIPIRCFAPMGSALCFPIESVVHWALARASILTLPSRYRRTFSRTSVMVYGDDILISQHLVPTVRKAYEDFGLLVNSHKSCYRTDFRESCGADCLRGCLITPPKLSRLFAPLSGDASTLAALVAFHNAFSPKWVNTRCSIRDAAVAQGLPCTIAPTGSPGLVFFDETRETFLPTRYNVKLHRLEKKVPVARQAFLDNDLDGLGQVHASVLGRKIDRVPVPGSLNLRNRWMPLETSVTAQSVMFD